MRVILIHGFNANPTMNFHPWLKSELESRGFEVLSPELPFNGSEPDFMLWLKEMEDKIGVIKADDIILGHSLGGVMAMRYLEAAEMSGTPRALILVASPWEVRREEMTGLFMTDLDFDVLMWKTKDFVVIHSRDDKSVPFEHALQYERALKATLVATEGDGHYMDAQYPILLETIETLAKKTYEFAPGVDLKNDFSAN